MIVERCEVSRTGARAWGPKSEPMLEWELSVQELWEVLPSNPASTASPSPWRSSGSALSTRSPSAQGCCACARMQGASGGTSAGHDWQVALPAGSPRAAIAAAARRTFVSSGGTSVSHDRQAAAAAGSPHRDRRGRSQDVRELGVDTLRASRDHLGRQQWQTRTCFGMSHASGPI